MTPAQCRMARAGLRVSLQDISGASLVSKSTILRFEGGKEINPVLHRALQTHLEGLGAIFPENGVQFREGEAA